VRFDTPWHDDELTAQSLAGGGAPGGGIREYMPDQHRKFFAALPYVMVTAVGADGWPAATLLSGEPGFITTPDAATLRIALSGTDPSLAGFAPGQAAGVLGLDLATRRRNRANGPLTGVDGALTIAVRQSFGNCPKYIQRRTVQPVIRTPAATETLAALDPAAETLIRGADTFFVASHARVPLDANGGADISHRGGQPGFVRLDGDTLTVPEFSGNHYYNTLGNLLGDPRAALLFVDFERGDLLHLQGTVEIDWRTPQGVEGAERSWRLHIHRAWRRRAAIPLRWDFVDASPFLAHTGVWSAIDHHPATAAA
jgi:predicted pyridoxine 5'-phosphate oxidase superfamily flavin-nucleotide-binding protein